MPRKIALRNYLFAFDRGLPKLRRDRTITLPEDAGRSALEIDQASVIPAVQSGELVLVTRRTWIAILDELRKVK
ncbi:MAG: hypothetical protein ABL921_18940 [Pirellula sp.]